MTRAQHQALSRPRRHSDKADSNCIVRLEEEVKELRETLAVEQADFAAEQQAVIEAQRELESSRERYANLYDSAPTGYILLDRNGFIHEANLTATRLFGVPRDRLIHTLLSRFVVEADRRKVLQHLSRCRHSTGDQQVVTELRMACADGRLFDIALTSTTQSPPPTPPALIRLRTALVDITERKRAEAAVQASEEQYRLLFESNPNSMWIFDDATLQFLAVNDAAVRLYGWTRAEFLGMTVKDIRPPEEVPELLRMMDTHRSPRLAFVGERRHCKKDGTVFDVEVTISRLRFQGRDARLTMANDITERKLSEEALRESLNRHRAFFEQAADAIVVFDPRTLAIVEFNDEACRNLGYTRAEFASLKVSDVDVIESALKIRRQSRQVAQRGGAVFETRHCTKSGKVLDVEVRAKPIQIHGRTFIQGIWRDITERKEAEHQLQELNATLERRVAERTAELTDANERLRAVMDNALVGILTLDERGAVESHNPAAAAIFGYAPHGMTGLNVRRLMASADQGQGEEFLSHYTQPGDQRFMAVGREVLGRRKDGRMIALELTVSDFTDRGRRHFVAMVRNIMKRKELERELLEVGDRERQQIGRELHDSLGQHLHALYYMATLFQNELKNVSPARAREAGRLAGYLEHALELTRGLARGLQPVNPVPEGLMQTLRELARQTRELYRVDCRFECRRPVFIHRHSAATHLYRIAQEAVNNAMKHGKPARIRITLTALRQHIVLGIRDNGTGITRRAARSPGMGLHVMQYRADAIGGALRVQRHPAGGTEIVCTVARQSLLPQEETLK